MNDKNKTSEVFTPCSFDSDSEEIFNENNPVKLWEDECFAWDCYFQDALRAFCRSAATASWNPADLVDRASLVADLAMERYNSYKLSTHPARKK